MRCGKRKRVASDAAGPMIKPQGSNERWSMDAVDLHKS